MSHINGAILTDKGFIEGHLEFEDGVIKRIDESMLPDPYMTGIVLPPPSSMRTPI